MYKHEVYLPASLLNFLIFCTESPIVNQILEDYGYDADDSNVYTFTLSKYNHRLVMCMYIKETGQRLIKPGSSDYYIVR